jgi:hypothetical protein
MRLELFEGVRRHSKPRASIRKSGQLGFNQAARYRWDLDDYSWAQLYFDEKAKAIAVRFTRSKPEKGALKVTKQSSNFAVEARTLVNKLGLSGLTGTFDLKELEPDPDTYAPKVGYVDVYFVWDSVVKANKRRKR